jgi:hypothetical protein
VVLALLYKDSQEVILLEMAAVTLGVIQAVAVEVLE